jgi:hypothetical protein
MRAGNPCFAGGFCGGTARQKRLQRYCSGIGHAMTAPVCPVCRMSPASVRGPWGTSSVCCSRVPRVEKPRRCAECGATSPRPERMPAGWRDQLVAGAHVFTCSKGCRP